MSGFVKKKNTKKVYQKGDFIILETSRSGYIVINITKDFKEGHTHVNNFKLAKSIIDLATRKRIPDNTEDKRLLESLIRVSSNKKYIDSLLGLMED